MHSRFSLTAVLAALALVVVLPRPALAAWFQWGTEGSYVHQTAHILFCGAMLFFIYEMHRSGLQKNPGFRQIKWACWLLVLWNLDAFAGHTLEWSLTNPVIVGQRLDKWLLMENAHTWAYYLTRFTHYGLVAPAFYLFYRGVKAFAQEHRG
jgi:hypothetical protein